MSVGTAVLIRLKNNTHGDATKDRRGCYKRGDPVMYRDLAGAFVSWTPGTLEYPPDFAWLCLWNATPAKVAKYVPPEYDTADGKPDGVAGVFRRRIFTLDIDLIPLAVRQKVGNTGVLHIGAIPQGALWKDTGAQSPSLPTSDFTWNQVRTFIRNKKSNLTEEQAGTTAGDLV